jgi:hypothetical protein
MFKALLRAKTKRKSLRVDNPPKNKEYSPKRSAAQRRVQPIKNRARGPTRK